MENFREEQLINFKLYTILSNDEILRHPTASQARHESCITKRKVSKYNKILCEREPHPRNFYYSKLLLFDFIINQFCYLFLYLIYELNCVIGIYVQEKT